ncbi:MerR family transcriptional regulator [Nocardia sp. NPDC003482]
MATDDLMARILDEIGDFTETDAAIPVEAIHRLVDAGDDPAPMSIAEVADMLDISAHSIRYYERAGLISVGRDTRGHRIYDAEAQRRLVFITRMRLSGMPMRDLQHYIHLAESGDDSIPERLDILLEHRDTIRRRIRELNLSLAATEYKIATYQHHGDVLGGTVS